MKTLTSCCFFLLYLCLFQPCHALPTWTFHGKVADGRQFDAVTGPDNKRVHLISSAYYQFASDGRRLVVENVGDEKQGSLDFPPALAVDPAGNVHVITRHGTSGASTGFDIRYRMRNADGGWSDDFYVGAREARNYVVGIAAPATGSVYHHYTKAGDNVWGDVRIWQKNNAFSSGLLGNIGGIWRADTDARMRGLGNKVFLVSGKCDGSGKTYFTHCTTGSNCFNELAANIRTHTAGNYRKGSPDLYVDKNGHVHITYGSQFEVYYNRYDHRQQPVFAQDKRIFSGLGSWHLQFGLSAVAASDDGSVVVAVALDPDGSKEASNSDLLWNYSLDGGASWADPMRLDAVTDGGEGRCRPRLVMVDDTFFLFFRDNASQGITLASLPLNSLVASAAPVMSPVHHLLLGK